MSIDVMKQALEARYEYQDGGLYVKQKYHGQVAIGDRAGTLVRDGYRQLRIHGKQYLEHRLIWLLHTGSLPTDEIDHINGDRQDNRIENLRLVSRDMNMQNQRTARRDNTSGLLGVRKSGAKWYATIGIDGKRFYLGMYTTPELAHLAYVNAKRKHHEGCTL
jgi:hypothetical protein